MKRLIWSTAIVALFATASTRGQTNATQARITASHSTVQRTTYLYATKDDQKLHLDRLVDDSVKITGKRAVIIFSYGGGWEGGGRATMMALQPALNISRHWAMT